MPLMETVSYKAVLDRLSGLDDWLDALGLKAQHDRVHRSISILARVQEAMPSGIPPPGISIEDCHFSFVDALEIHDILMAFGEERTEVMAGKVKQAFSGPLRPWQERPVNSVARNTMFELSLAADWRLKGMKVSLGESDLVLNLGGVPFLVECKRPFSVKKWRDNVRDAKNQLQRKLDVPARTSAFGLIAVSATRSLGSARRVFVAGNQRGVTALDRDLSRLFETQKPMLGRLSFHPRTTAFLIHVATPSRIEGTISRLSYTLISAIGQRGPAYQVLRDYMRWG